MLLSDGLIRTQCKTTTTHVAVASGFYADGGVMQKMSWTSRSRQHPDDDVSRASTYLEPEWFQEDIAVSTVLVSTCARLKSPSTTPCSSPNVECAARFTHMWVSDDRHVTATSSTRCVWLAPGCLCLIVVPAPMLA